MASHWVTWWCSKFLKPICAQVLIRKGGKIWKIQNGDGQLSLFLRYFIQIIPLVILKIYRPKWKGQLQLSAVRQLCLPSITGPPSSSSRLETRRQIKGSRLWKHMFGGGGGGSKAEKKSAFSWNSFTTTSIWKNVAPLIDLKSFTFIKTTRISTGGVFLFLLNNC